MPGSGRCMILTGQMRLSKPANLAGPYFKADIPDFHIDYRGLTAFARKKGIKVCDLSDEDKDRFITNADMRSVRKNSIKL